jgi:putative transposase
VESLSQREPGVAAELGAGHAVFQLPPDIRKAIYTTNSVESLNRSLRKIIKTRGGFPNEEAALKLLFLALRQAAKKWTW